MISITRKEECCGCQACGDICPKGAISFKTDQEGIWYPEVNLETCIDCHLCEKVCPFLNRVTRSENSNDPVTYILQAPNSIDRLKSASGGAYTLLVQEVFKRGGYVAGHIWNDKASVKGYISCRREDLDILRGTKYLQSDVEGIYKAVKQLLGEGKFVLFSGCPCQTAALRSFLKKDFDNLLMTDFVCMGIDSPWAFRKYIESLENQFHAKMVFFKAKSKEVGWRYLTNKAQFANGRSYFGIINEDANLKATFLNVLVRPSCYECKYKGFPRNSDMTIGDYWRNTITEDSLDDNTGTSYIMLHNMKAMAFFEKVKENCQIRKTSIMDILGANTLAIQSLCRPTFSRDIFYKRLKTEDFAAVVEDFVKKTRNKDSRRSLYVKIVKNIIGGIYYYRKSPLSFIMFIYYNFISSRVRTNIKKGDILILRGTKLKLGKNATIIVKGNCIIDGRDDNIDIILGNNAQMVLNGNLIDKNTRIMLHQGACLSLGFKTIVGKGVNMNIESKVDIGDFCFIDNNVTIDSTDSGIVYFDGTDVVDKNIMLGTHTLLCQGCKVCSPTAIGDESIVREYSLIKGFFPARSVVAGVPAKVVDNNIYWKHNFDFIWNYKN